MVTDNKIIYYNVIYIANYFKIEKLYSISKMPQFPRRTLLKALANTIYESPPFV